MGERLTVVLDDGISELLIELAGSSRRQGEYLSGLIRAAWENEQAGLTGDMDREGLRLQVLGLAGQVKMLEGRVLRIEGQLAAVMAAEAGHK